MAEYREPGTEWMDKETYRSWKSARDSAQRAKERKARIDDMYKHKPGIRRGYNRKFDEEKGWTYVPNRGFGTFFLTSFTSFLAILVVLNICMGTGYTGYKAAVTGLYGITETVGNVVSNVAQGLGAFITFPGKVYPGVIENYRGETVNLAKNGLIFTIDDCKVYAVRYSWHELRIEVGTRYVVLYSEHEGFQVGDDVISWWFFSRNVKNFRTDTTYGNVVADPLHDASDYEFLEGYYT